MTETFLSDEMRAYVASVAERRIAATLALMRGGPVDLDPTTWRHRMTDDLTPDELLAIEAKADIAPAAPVEGAEGLPDEVYTDEINDEEVLA